MVIFPHVFQDTKKNRFDLILLHNALFNSCAFALICANTVWGQILNIYCLDAAISVFDKINLKLFYL